MEDSENMQSFEGLVGDIVHDMVFGQIKTLEIKVQAQECEIQNLREHVRMLDKRLDDFMAGRVSDCIPETTNGEDDDVLEVDDIGGENIASSEPSTTSATVEGSVEALPFQ